MIPVAAMLKPYAEAGALNELLNLYGFVDDGVFLTKSGSVGLVLCVRGVDDECLEIERREQVVRQFAGAIRLFDEQFRIYQYLLKRRMPALTAAPHAHPVVDDALRRRAAFLNGQGLQVLENWFVVLLEPRPGRVRWALGTRRRLAGELHEMVARLRDRTAAFCVQLVDTVRPVPASRDEAFSFLRRLLNYDPCKADAAALKHDTFLDYYVADSLLECHRDHLRLDDHRVRVLTLKEPPACTSAGALRALCGLPAEFIAVSEWQREGQGPMRKAVQAKRRHFHNSRVSFLNYIDGTPQGSRDVLIDEGATALVDDLGACLRDMEVRGDYFGAFSLTIVLFDTDAARLNTGVAECVKIFAARDAVLTDERYNLLNAWLAAIPGNAVRNLRRMYLLNTNYADLSFLFTVDQGDRRNDHLGRECLAVLETEDQTPFHLNLHDGDVAHAVVLGATGSGKSFLLNFLLTHLQKYDPYTVIFDLGAGYESLTARMGGGYLRLGLDRRAVTINPFALPPTPEERHFVFRFVKVLLESGAPGRLTIDEDREVYEQVGNVYELDADQRRLLTLSHMLPRHLARHLYRWVGSGPYAALFDNVDDTLTCAPFQCFDFGGLDSYPQLLEPLLFYVLHRASAVVAGRGRDSRFKVLIVDEAWRFLRNATIKDYLTEALKTWRKRNAALVLATQSTGDLAASDVLRIVAESCSARFFLATAACDAKTCREVFGLNDVEIDRIGRLAPRRQLLVKRPGISKVLNLNVPPDSGPEERTVES